MSLWLKALALSRCRAFASPLSPWMRSPLPRQDAQIRSDGVEVWWLPEQKCKFIARIETSPGASVLWLP